MAALDFHPLNSDPELTPGIAYRRRPDDKVYLRITHAFPKWLYLMEVSDDLGARHARRPFRLARAEFEVRRAADGNEGCFGHLDLPKSMLWPPQKDTKEHFEWDARVKAVAPLVKLHASESNLRAARFTSCIRDHAMLIKMPFATLKRDVLRFYYFGRDDRALVNLAPGPKPNAPKYEEIKDASGQTRPRRRPGPKPVLSKKMKASEFRLQPLDIEEMHEAIREMRRQMPTATMDDCCEHYVMAYFSISHPKEFAEWGAEKTSDPVTSRMMWYHTRGRPIPDSEKPYASKAAVAKRVTGALYAMAAGAMYEADATGARVILVTEKTNEDGHPVEIGSPTLYLIIDRWSRFCVGAYLTVGTNSSEELRHSLMLAFGPREALQRLGIEATDDTWPRGQVCSTLVTDRGSEYLSEATAQEVADGLRINHRVLRARHKDGKAIIERFNATLKNRLGKKLSGKGAYYIPAIGYDGQQGLKKAKNASVTTILDAWAALIESVIQYNNTPHTLLMKDADCIAARISTPIEAYKWSINEVAGKHTPRHSDDQMYQMLLDTADANLKKRMLFFEGNGYEPADALARSLAAKAPLKAGKKVLVKVDAFTKWDVFMKVGVHGQTAHFTATKDTLRRLGTLGNAELAALKPHSQLANATTKNRGKIQRVFGGMNKPKKEGRSVPPAQVDGDTKRSLRKSISTDLKTRLTAPAHAPTVNARSDATVGGGKQAPRVSSWRDRDAARQKASHDRARKLG